AAPVPPRGGGMLKIMAILVLVGLVLGGVGFLVIGVVNASVYNTAKNCATASNPGLCGAQAQANLYNDTGIGEIISGVGFVLAGIGFGMFLLALPRKFDELAQKP
ncbi:MAG: hypothetical protein M1144_01215, partial [Candidatus Thermoplasmatota archaeon]|nr:hypothetical protein [Candidatus Thermoplasmatota archaeon]